VKPEPSRINPVFSPRPWGARSLAPLFPDKTNLAEPLGEAWLTSVDCQIASGPFQGKSLGAAWATMTADWRGTGLTSLTSFPILVKFLFPTDKLSIQVHPGDAYASVHEQAAGGRGKTEMWHVVSAEPEARLLLGLNHGVTKQQFQEQMGSQSLEKLFKSYAVKPGETFFISAGTPHTIGPGMILCEVQQYSDLTYRLYDYGRVGPDGKPRDLHIAKAFEVMKFDAGSDARVKSLPLPQHDALRLFLAGCPYFATERWEFSSNLVSESTPSHFDILVILSGSGILRWQGGKENYRGGQCWLVPATLGKFEMKPDENTSLIRTYVPNLPALRAELQSGGVAEAKLESVLFD
jgi:mannose-6-phosphate isomerase